MSPTLRIAWRFLTARRRSMAMSLACIVLGVGLFVVTQATTSGFEAFFIRTILGTNGAVRIEDRVQDTIRLMFGARDTGSKFTVSMRDEGVKYIEGVDEPAALLGELARFPNVSGATAVLTGSVQARSSLKAESVRAYGIELDEFLAVSALGTQIVRGSLEDYRRTPSGILIGIEMARRLELALGDTVILEANGDSRRYLISAVYETGVSEIDRSRVYLPMREARSLLRRATGASFIQVALHDEKRAQADAEHIRAVLGHRAQAWQDRERTWLSVFSALRLSSGITVSVFTLIAGLAMFNTLAMIVLEKTKEIAILRSMGYTREDISRIFLWQAVIVLGIGAVLGSLLGAAVTYGVSRVPIDITGIFATKTFRVAWSPWHYVAGIGTAIVMVMFASLWPARRAARLEPGDVIRGTSQ